MTYYYHSPKTLKYKGKLFHRCDLYYKGKLLYKLKLTPEELYQQVQGGDALYRIYVTFGVKFVRKSDGKILGMWNFT